jgi:AraC-like DNA-binding protein
MPSLENSFQNRPRKQFMVNPNFEICRHKTIESIKVEWHHHDYHEIYIFLSGDVEYFVEGSRYELTPGDILIISNKELHKPEIKPGTVYERIVLFIRPEFIISRSIENTNLLLCFDVELRGKNRLIHPADTTLTEMINIINKLFSVMNTEEYGANLLKDIYITELLVYINRNYLETAQRNNTIRVNDKLIEKIVNYININIDGNLSLDIIAKNLFVSKYYMSHYFKRYTGSTLHNYIRFKRLQIARSAIRSGASVALACEMSGFGEYNNFIRVFKKQYGLTPKKFSKTGITSNFSIE